MMGRDDDGYEIDPQDYRVLIELAAAVFRLEAVEATPSLYVDILPDDVQTPEEARWMELLDKHDLAMLPCARSDRGSNERTAMHARLGP